MTACSISMDCQYTAQLPHSTTRYRKRIHVLTLQPTYTKAHIHTCKHTSIGLGIFATSGFSMLVERPLPHVHDPLRTVIRVLKLCLGENTYSVDCSIWVRVSSAQQSSLQQICKFMIDSFSSVLAHVCHVQKVFILPRLHRIPIFISLFCIKIESIYGHCFISIAYGAKNMVKTTTSEVCVAAVGQQEGTIKEITDAHLHRMLWGGLPFVYDDPSDVKQLKPLLMKAFGGGVIGS